MFAPGQGSNTRTFPGCKCGQSGSSVVKSTHKNKTIMAYPGKIMRNAKTGIVTQFIRTSQSTGGQLLEMETTYPPHSPEPPPHFHPCQEEGFIVLSGAMTVRIDGQLRVLHTGDTLHIPKNKVHSMWNHTDAAAVVNWQVFPALDTEYFFETATGLANDHQLAAKGKRNLLQTALLMRRFFHVFRLAKPPVVVQRLMFGALALLGRLRGYRDWYPAYID